MKCIMKRSVFKEAIMVTLIACFFCFSCDTDKSTDKKTTETPESFTPRITDKPLTFCNPLTLSVGQERARRAGEPVVLIYKDDYYLFITGSRGYWYGDNLRDLTYVDAPDFPGGVVSVITDGETMWGCSMNSKDVFTCTDPKSGVWTKAGTFDSDRYGDANMYLDDDGRLYLYYGWSQIMPFKVVELDPKTFKEISEPKVLFFGDYEAHGFERRRDDDVIFSIFNHRIYYSEEYPWIEGPWVTKHNGKYYLQYAAIGLEFSSYSHGVYVSDNPMGPYKYSPHNPLTFKTTGYMVGAGHGSTFHDKDGQLWTICMVPSNYGPGRGSSEMALFPTAVDADSVMHSTTTFGDYPQYYPGVKGNAIDNNFTGWMLLSHKKYVEVSSTLEGYAPANAVDENFMTHWCAETGDPGEYMTVDLGKVCDIYAMQVNFDRNGAKMPAGVRFGFGAGDTLEQFQSYTVEISNDNKTWSMLLDKSNLTKDLRHDYTELEAPAKARYVKLTNVFTHDEGKFAVKDFRIFGNPDVAKFTKVKDVSIVRNPEDRRDVTLLWQPVPEADGYVIRYGIEPDKLYNSYMIYDAYTLTIPTLNRDEEYYFEVEAFDNGTDYYRERSEKVNGMGAEIELSKGKRVRGMGFGQPDPTLVRKMLYEGVEEYVFEGITPETYTLRHSFGPVLWSGELTAAELIGSGDQPTVTAKLTELGKGTEVLGHMDLKVIPGKESGKIVVTLTYDK